MKKLGGLPAKWRWNEICFILGGGPSLKNVDIELLRGRGRVIAINDAYQLCPFADVVYWADTRWFRLHHERLADHTAPFKVTRADPEFRHQVSPLYVLKLAAGYGLSSSHDTITGIDGGANAINVAHLLGAGTIVLLGYDMRANGHWHNGHEGMKPTDQTVYDRDYIPAYGRLALSAQKLGLKILNATTGSALKCFETARLDKVLGLCLAE